MIRELTQDEINYAQELLEQRAGEESDTGHPRFLEWLGDVEPAQLARIFSAKPGPQVQQEVSRIRNDYVQHRAANASAVEREELMERITEYSYD